MTVLGGWQRLAHRDAAAGASDAILPTPRRKPLSRVTPTCWSTWASPAMRSVLDSGIPIRPFFHRPTISTERRAIHSSIPA